MKNENPSSEAKEPVLSGSRTDRKQTVDVVQRNWRAEVETAQVYRDLAGHEKDEKRRGILLRMAEAEERHAQRWEKKLVDLLSRPMGLRFSLCSVGGRHRCADWRFHSCS